VHDLAATAEIQALRQYAARGASIFSKDSPNRGSLALFQTHKDLGLIYTVTEVANRLIADKKGITTLVGLKGKKIGSFPSTSPAYFIEELLASAGLKPTDYTVFSACAQLHREGQAHSFFQGLESSREYLQYQSIQHSIPSFGCCWNESCCQGGLACPFVQWHRLGSG
jgi:hypothetical protein